MKTKNYLSAILVLCLFISACSTSQQERTREIASLADQLSCYELFRRAPIVNPRYDREILGAFKLRLKSEDGSEIIEQEANNFLLSSAGRPHSYASGFVDEYFSRGAEGIEELNNRMTLIHADNEMTFMTKDAKTGQYTKVSKVPFRGFVPMPHSTYEKLTGSTEAFMRTFREVLQRVYSGEHTAKYLTIDSLPKGLQNVFLDVLRTNIYYEPKLNKKVMKDYPFSAVVGFDFAIDNILNPKPISYEANGSTPSGLSNNLLLKHALQLGDKELFDKISERMVQGNPFKSLKKTIEDNALKWTNKEEGISVIIGPGSGNAAHPDVASIAEFSGMPLVEPKDLYIDASGFVRLNTGKGSKNPVVTGVYSRADESFLLQSSKKDIPIRDPAFYEETNKKLARKYGVTLEPHVGYKYTYSKTGLINGIEFGDDGKPLLMESSYKLGVDPTRAESEQGEELVDALLNRKIYISNIGGRTLDDKRIFQLIADYLSSRYLPEGLRGVGPTRTLGLDNLNELFETPIDKLGKFVIKEPDGSGGKGVYILANEPDSVRREVVAKVRKNPTYYTIQEFADQSLVVTTNRGDSGQVGFETTAMDARYYAMLDGEDKLVIDPDAFLVRVASPLSGSTNTSKGAGYGLLFIVDDTGALKTFAKGEEVLPISPEIKNIGISRQVQLENFGRQINYLINVTSEGQGELVQKFGVESLVALHRDILDLLGLNFSPFIQKYRAFLDKKISTIEFHDILLDLRRALEARGELSLEVKEILSLSLRKSRDIGLTNSKVMELSELSALVGTSEIKGKIHKIKMDYVFEGATQKELFKVTESSDEYVFEMIKELGEFEGELRHIGVSDSKGSLVESLLGQNYFRFDGLNRPVLGVNMRSPSALSSLAHEFQHFKDWREAYLLFRKEGKSKAQSRKLAREKVMDLTNVENSEARAVEAELFSEENVVSPFNRVRGEFAQSKNSIRFIHRVLYPKVESLKKQLIESGGEVTPLLRDEATKIIETARYERDQMILRLERALKNSQGEDLEAHQKLSYLKERSLFEIVFSDISYRNFSSLGFGESIKELFESTMNKEDLYTLRLNDFWQGTQQQQ
ncbi:MAG: circularly permuted type 2 ATP-grasp protein [Bacteriovoracaceae bacterium]|nr:circularly permuted type 2 ATP-grasp protein [Bacteriovoracaceae bacterium]